MSLILKGKWFRIITKPSFGPRSPTVTKVSVKFGLQINLSRIYCHLRSNLGGKNVAENPRIIIKFRMTQRSCRLKTGDMCTSRNRQKMDDIPSQVLVVIRTRYSNLTMPATTHSLGWNLETLPKIWILTDRVKATFPLKRSINSLTIATKPWKTVKFSRKRIKDRPPFLDLRSSSKTRFTLST